MRRDFVCSIVTALCLTALLAVSTTSAFAQGQPEPAGVNPAGGGVPMRSLERLKAKDLDPSWFGDSRGTWQGDTLVIDTVGFNDKFWFDGIGHPHTEKLHVIERYRRPDAAHLGYEVTIDDPGAYTRPFTMYGLSPLIQNTEIMEYFCIENNQDVAHILGKGTPAKE